MTTTYEEAKLCPRCGMPGEEVSQVPSPKRSIVHVIYCRNSECKWFNTSWLVQVNADGSIPTAEHQLTERKKFPALPSHEAGAERIMEALRLDKEAQTRKGAELRRPS